MRHLLRHQVLRHFSEEDLAGSAPLRALMFDLEAVLAEADDHRKTLEHSLDLVSHELLDRNLELHEALRGGRVGTWALEAGADEIVLNGFPHPVVGYVRGRAVVPVPSFLAAVVGQDRGRVSEALAARGPDALDVRFWVEGSRGRRWIEMRGGRTDGGTGRRVGVCLDVTREAEAAERRETIERYHAELVRLAHAISEGWGSLETVYPRITEQVASTLGVDRVGVWLLDDGGTEMVCVDRYRRSTGHHEAGHRLSLVEMPTYARAIATQRVVAAEDLAVHPVMCELIGRLAPGVRSALQASIFVRGQLRGMVTLGHLGPDTRTWTADDHVFAASVADVVALALEGERLLRAETALDEQRRFLRAVIDADPNLIFARDRDGRFTLVNRAFADFWGTTTEQMLGRDPLELGVPHDVVARWSREDQRVIETGTGALTAELPVAKPTGEVGYFQVAKQPIVAADGCDTLVLGVATDITPRKLAEDRRAHLEEHLRQAQRLEALGLLAGGVAHDFNNLLTPILAYAEMSLIDAPGGSELADSLGEIIGAAERARDLTRQLLAFGRKQTLVVRPVDLNDEVYGARKMLTRVLPENIEIELRLAAALPPVRVDASQLQQVLLNLAVNARDAMPGGGRLTFATQLVSGPGQGTVVLSVSDTGHGMSDEVRAQIFQPFYTTKELGKGTGLGLATVYGIVQQHAGTIEVASVPGQGASFTIRLPAAPADDAVAPPNATVKIAAIPQATVLVVEDEPFVRRLVCEVLRRRGLDVLSAGGPDEALALAGGHRGGIDLLLTDVIMPGMNGHELYQRLIEQRRDLQVLFMTGYARDVLGMNGVVEDELRLLQKPFSPGALLTAIDEALAARGGLRAAS